MQLINKYVGQTFFKTSLLYPKNNLKTFHFNEVNASMNTVNKFKLLIFRQKNS